jgi:threonine aldolase
LQARAAELFGREAALLLPSGSMSNLVAIRSQTHHGSEVICEERGHMYQFEIAAISAVAGCLPRPIYVDDGILSWDRIAAKIQPATYARAQTALVSLESSHNMAGGTVYPVEITDEICDAAHAKGLKVHMDGARIFNAAVALGRSVADLTRKCDSVTFCLSKGLGAPVGSILLGSRQFIETARIYRKMFGGGMRQAGILAAAGLIALEKSPGRLLEDHANARHLAAGLAKIPGIRIDLRKVQTNIVIFDVAQTKRTAADLAGTLASHRILAHVIGPHALRMVTHCDVDRAGIDRALAVFAGILSN